MAIVIAPPDMLPEMMIAPQSILLFVVAIISLSSSSEDAANIKVMVRSLPPVFHH
jgi:hypothetical protein